QADQPAAGCGRARRHDADPAQALFQRAWPRQAVAGGCQRQEAARQARERKEARLEQRKRPAVAGTGIKRPNREANGEYGALPAALFATTLRNEKWFNPI